MKLLTGVLIAFLILLFAGFANAATIKGKVTDVATGDPLPGANIFIEGTSLGSASDTEGRYVIPRIPPGQYTIRIRYIGYEEAKYTIRVTQLNETVTQDAALVLSVIEGQEVTITAQAQGQLAAINQQLSADAMMNVVDGARIQEVPDQNAAESIARLPGITVSRNNGEGSGIGIRGLAPQYNQIQIDGVEMGSAPSLGRADDFEFSQNRSVSLANISQENLDGIEVYKAITPDMDAATLGGTVNMRLSRAQAEPLYEVRAYGAYNGLSENWKQYKVIGRASRRLFDDKFGFQLSVNAEQRDRGSDRLRGDIQREDTFDTTGTVRTSTFRTGAGTEIRNIRAIRTKQSINAIFDYATPGTELLFSNFYNIGGLTSREISRQGDRLDGYKTESNSYTLSNALRGTHDLPGFEVEWQLSHFRTETETPEDYRIRWSMSGETPMPAHDWLTGTPETYLEMLPDDGDWTFFRTYKDEAKIGETRYVGKLDIKYPFYFNKISGFIKAGGQLKRIERESMLKKRDLHNGRFPRNPADTTNTEGPRWRDYTTDYNPDPVLNERVSIRHFFDVDKIKPVWTDWIKNHEEARYQTFAFDDNEDYEIQENYYAGYLMLKLNAFKELITFIPGVRYEGETFDARGYYWYLTTSSETVFTGLIDPTTGKPRLREATRSSGFWLPMIHLKVKPLDWFDTRLAITKTISRPNYKYRIPYVTVNYKAGETVKRGDPDIKTAESWNFDLSTSLYSNKFGLFTIAGFYKEIKNLSFMIDYYMSGNEDAIAYGLSPADSAFKAGHYKYKDVSTPENTYDIATVKGIEVDYQANLKGLPGLLKNVVFSINYTRAFSDAWLRQYQVTLDSITYTNKPPYKIEHKTYDTGFRPGPLLTQPDHILNTAIGYDIGGFSGRVSFFFQSSSLSGMGKLEKSDTYVENFWRYDISLRYRINDHLSFLATGVNLTSTPDVTSLSGTSKHSTYAVYGAMYDFGIQYIF